MTFLELLIAIAICIFAVASIASFVYCLNQAQYDYQTKIKLTNDARLLIDKMMWGMRALGQPERRGICEAVSATAMAGNTQVDYRDTDGTTHTLRFNNGNIEYRRGTSGLYTVLLDPDGTPAFDPVHYSVNVSFSESPSNNRVVIIELILGNNIRGRWHYASLSTQAFLRNS